MTYNILSIDVEEIFHAEYAKHMRISRQFEYRTPSNIPLILDFLKDLNVTATFFIVGELAEKFPETIKMISEEGHEIAFHGLYHEPLWRLTPKKFAKELRIFKSYYPNCIGFRAPSFSLNNSTRWALKVLKENGFLYDSSVFPAWSPLYGVPNAPIKPYKPSLSDLTVEDRNELLWEFPLTVCSILKLRIPAAGGFYLRFMPSIVKIAIRKLNNYQIPAIIFVHSWELDPYSPKLNLGLYKSFVTYYKIDKVSTLLEKLLKEFKFINFREYMELLGW